MNIEPLEARIAPAKLRSLVDVDGDFISIVTTKGTDTELLGVVTTSMPSGAVAGGVAIDLINLAGNVGAFDGTSITVTAKRGPLGGDGLVNVGSISAAGLDLGTVTVKGDLSDLDAGKGTPASKVAAINVNSATGSPVWTLNCSVGSLTVKTNVTTTEINISGASIGKLTIGGSLIGGGGVSASGYIHVDAGTIGPVKIGGSIVGTDVNSGQLKAKSITSVTVGGSILGSGGTTSGAIQTTDAAGSLGLVFIKGEVRGGSGANSGLIYSAGKIGAVTIGGSLVGDGGGSGRIEGVAGLGKIKLGQYLRGGATSADSGKIVSGGSIAGVTVGGDVLGGGGANSGRIYSTGGDLGPVSIGGHVLGGDGGFISGSITASGKIASVKIGGSLRGASGDSSGTIEAGTGGVGSVTIGGDFTRGNGNAAGLIRSSGPLGAITIGGSVNSAVIIGSTGASDPAIKSLTIVGSAIGLRVLASSADAIIGPVKVGGDWQYGYIAAGASEGGDGAFGTNDDVSNGVGNPALFSKIASITIGGAVLGSPASLSSTDHYGFVAQQIGALSIGGTKIPLNPKHGDDTDANDSRYIISLTRDFTVHEVA